MVHKSASKIFRDVKRITKFCYTKNLPLPIKIPVLSITVLPNISIPPDSFQVPTLSINKATSISISAVKKALSIQKLVK